MIPNIVDTILKGVLRTEFEDLQYTVQFHHQNNRSQWLAISRLEDWAKASDSNFVVLEKDIRHLVLRYRQLLSKYSQLIEINTQILEFIKKKEIDSDSALEDLIEKFDKLKIQN